MNNHYHEWKISQTKETFPFWGIRVLFQVRICKICGYEEVISDIESRDKLST